LTLRPPAKPQGGNAHNLPEHPQTNHEPQQDSKPAKKMIRGSVASIIRRSGGKS
jgi:hypothetical protein